MNTALSPTPNIDYPSDVDFMHQALVLAQQAATLGEVPVGAIVVYQGTVVGQGAA